MDFWKTKAFKNLETEWYEKLLKNGFVDIEQDENFLRRMTADIFRKKVSDVTNANKASYYAIISSYVQEESFKDEADRIIMTMVSDGARIKSISCVLKSKGFKNNRATVRFTIRRYEMKWGIKTYEPQQLSSAKIA